MLFFSLFVLLGEALLLLLLLAAVLLNNNGSTDSKVGEAFFAACVEDSEISVILSASFPFREALLVEVERCAQCLFVFSPFFYKVFFLKKFKKILKKFTLVSCPTALLC